MTLQSTFALISCALIPSVIWGDEAAKELERLQGMWTLVAAEEAGKDQTNEMAKKLSIVVKGDTWSFKFEGQPKTLDMKLKLDPSAKPKAVDFASTIDKDEPSPGIYELENDKLKVCWSKRGMARPDEFTTKPGDKRIFLTLKRVKVKED